MEDVMPVLIMKYDSKLASAMHTRLYQQTIIHETDYNTTDSNEHNNFGIQGNNHPFGKLQFSDDAYKFHKMF